MFMGVGSVRETNPLVIHRRQCSMQVVQCASTIGCHQALVNLTWNNSRSRVGTVAAAKSTAAVASHCFLSRLARPRTSTLRLDVPFSVTSRSSSSTSSPSHLELSSTSTEAGEKPKGSGSSRWVSLTTEVIEDKSGWDVVYSDGACKGNGKVGSVAGVGVWWGENNARNIAERCAPENNNRAEIIVCHCIQGASVGILAERM
ncbi:hypothetical protein C8Q74DRAFT_680787 [Fomes fomentarius]|nr:hypothetical protein C8Q74DRAFT_680787 [Fomes fomentarius]